MTRDLPFYSACVDWPEDQVPKLGYLIDHGRDIGRRAFLKHVDRGVQAALERDLCYAKHPSQGLTMAADWHVSYHVWRGIYWFRWSAIEHVFATAEQIESVPDRHEAE